MLEDLNTNQMKCSLIDYENIAKHYLLQSSSHPRVRGGPSSIKSFENNKPSIKRHYTESFCMRENITKSILTLAEDP